MIVRWAEKRGKSRTFDPDFIIVEIVVELCTCLPVRYLVGRWSSSQQLPLDLVLLLNSCSSSSLWIPFFPGGSVCLVPASS